MEKIKLLKVIVEENAKVGSKPLYEYIIEVAKEVGIDGATAFKGIKGIGKSGKEHKTKLFKEDAPILVEIIFSEEKLKLFLEKINHLNTGVIAVLDGYLA